ncbi:MAG: CHAT domain-containing protein [Acetobacteraceae bacterium]|nr:CHAT domain-containing protein [Acetobacteraceae bacterium]
MRNGPRFIALAIIAIILAPSAGAQQGEPTEITRAQAEREAEASLQAAALDFQSGAPDQALQKVLRARVMYQQAGDKKGEAVALIYAGIASQAFRTPEGYRNAVDYLKAAIPLFAAVQDQFDQGTAALGLGASLEGLGRTAEARDAYAAALALLDARERGRERARALIGLATAEHALHALPDARAHVQQALPLLTAPQDLQARANALMQLAMVCDDQKDWGCAGDAFLSGADAQRGLSNLAMEKLARDRGAQASMRLAKDLERRGDTEGADKAYTRAANAWHAIGDGTAEAYALLSAGQMRSALGDWAGAQADNEAALAAAGEGPARATALTALASLANRRGDYQRALGFAEQALPLLNQQDLAAERATVLLIAGNAAAGVHDNARALRYLHEAQGLQGANPSVLAGAFSAEAEIVIEAGDARYGAELARQAMLQHQQLHNEAAANKDRNDLGLALAAMGLRSEALAQFEASLAAARTHGDLQQQAASLSNMAKVHLDFGDLPQALALFRQAREAARSSGDRDTEATATASLGMAYHMQGDEASALAELQAAIAIRRESNDRRGEAIELDDLALVKSGMGDPQAALDLYQKTRKLFASLSDTYHEATTLNGIGSVYRSLGALQEARRYYKQAAEIDERAHDDESLAVVLNNLAVAEQAAEEPDDALADYERSLSIEMKLGGLLPQVSLRSGMAMAHDAKGDHVKALELLTQSLELARQIGSPEGEALAMHNRGTVREKMGDLGGALGDLQQALPIWDRIGAVQNEATTRFVIARVNLAQGRIEGALPEVQKAIGLYESQRGRLASEDLRASWLAGASGAYELRTELLMRREELNPGRAYTEQALEGVEAGRARSLLDLLNESQAKVFQHADAAQVARLGAIRRALSRKAAQQAKLGRTGPDGIQLAREIDDLIAEHDRIEAAIRAADPAYAALTAPASMTTGRIQALLDPDTVLLDFALGEKRSFVWVVTPSSVAAYVLPARAALLASADTIREAIDLHASRKSFEEASSVLGSMLLGPIAAQIKGKRLAIVADAELQSRVPFAALTMPGEVGEHGLKLIEAHELVMEPSVAALEAIRRAATARPHPPGQVAVLADPVFSPDDPRLRRASPAGASPSGARGLDPGSQFASTGFHSAPQSGGPGLRSRSPESLDRTPDFSLPVIASGTKLQRLPATEAEAKAILAIAGHSHSLARFGFDATREAAEDPTLAGYRIVHFATHGLTDTTTPALSGLVFSLFAPDGTPQEGYLRLGDVFGLSLPVDLVVLSACGSATGRETRGEGVVGISRGFLYAGAASVVATLWEVNDNSTAELMTRFYAAMLGAPPMRPAAALRAAQRAMIAGPRWNEPFRWAAFTIQGEWR